MHIVHEQRAQASLHNRCQYYLSATVVVYLVILVAGAGIRLTLLNFRVGFILMGVAAGCGLLLGGVILRYTINNSLPDVRSAVFCWITLIISPLPFAYFFYQTLPALQVPTIHDISTDTVNPPEFVAVTGLRSAKDHATEYAGESVASLQHKAYPDIRTLELNRPPGLVARQIKDCIREQGWRLLASPGDPLHIEAVVTSTLLKFKNDLAIRLQPAGSVTRVDIRSASRLGKSDLGQNARRIRKLTSCLR